VCTHDPEGTGLDRCIIESEPVCLACMLWASTPHAQPVRCTKEQQGKKGMQGRGDLQRVRGCRPE
jgi:hypothetical protein